MSDIKLYSDKGKTKQINKFVIPFAFQYQKEDAGFEQFITNLCAPSKDKWYLKNAADKNNELYEHILTLIPNEIQSDHTDNNNSIGYMIGMNNLHEVFPKMNFTGKKIKSHTAFQMKEIDCILFRTGIGFLVITLNYDKFTDLDDMIEANFQFKAIKHSNLYGVDYKTLDISINDMESSKFNKNQCYKICNPQDKEHPYILPKEAVKIKEKDIDDMRLITVNGNTIIRIKYYHISDKPVELNRIIDELLSDFDVVTYFNQYYSDSSKKNYAYKANLFSAIILDSKYIGDQELDQSFFRLMHGYSKNYKVDAGVCLERSSEIYKPFYDSTWGISREGVANLTYDSNEFLKNEFMNRTKTYFYLYIIALHQYYGLLYLAQRISYLPVELDKYSETKYHQQLTDIYNECNIFYLKCIFNEVSHITHQAIYYERIMDALRIRRMQKEINYEMEPIAVIAEQVKLKKEAKQKEENENREKNIQFIISVAGIILSLIAFIATFDDALSFWTNVGNSNSYFKGHELLNAFITMGVLFLLILISFMVILILHKNKSKKDK